jgi:N-acetyl-anhydromuramyl-L-alanine amidase AmpD
MTKHGDDFKWYSGPTPIAYNRVNDEPFHIKNGWRGYNWYAPYSQEQYEATLFLVKYLCDEFNIKKNVIPDNEYHPEILDGNFEGIYNHSNVRDYPSDRNKWDLSPAFPLKKLLKELV